jgi:hypothetical protein
MTPQSDKDVRRLSELTARLNDLSQEIESLDRMTREYEETLRKGLPWWRVFIGDAVDDTLIEQWNRRRALVDELSRVRSELVQLEKLTGDSH